MNNPVAHPVRTFALLGMLLLPLSGAHAQAYLETYGQNRVQYRKFDWRYFDTEHFRVFHYDAAGRQLARYLSEQAEKDIGVVEQRLGGQFPRRFKIILYNNYDEYRQTNVGKKDDSQIQDVPAGTVDLVGDRLVVYFTGVHADLRRQLRAGMSRVVMQRMLFGENFREMVKNAVLLNLPRWTTDGFIAYLVDGWDSKADNEWKNMLAARQKEGFYELAERDPELAGKAFWKYISVRYGDNNMKNLLYAMELKSSLNQGIKMVLGMQVQQAYDSCTSFYREMYVQDSLVQERPDTTKKILEIPVPHDNSVIRTVRTSPHGNDVAYVVWKEGEFSVYIQKTRDEQTRHVILNDGDKDYNEQHPDPDYPLLTWSNNGYKLAILYCKGTQTRLRIYNSLKAKIENYVIPGNRFDRVTGISFMENDDKLVFSAIRKSQTDLYEFTIRGSRMKNITNDAWDDIQPCFISGGSRRGILFLSNRPQPSLQVPIGVNELPVGQMNIYFYDTRTESPVLLRCSDVPSGTITQPIQYGSDNFAFLHDANGVQNKYVVMFGRDHNNHDSAYAVPVTNYYNGIISHQYNPASNQVADVLQEGDNIRIYFRELELPGVNVTPKTLQPAVLSVHQETHIPAADAGFTDIRELKRPAEPEQEPERERDDLMKDGEIFQSEFANEPRQAPADRAPKETPPADVPAPAAPAAGDISDGAADTLPAADSSYVKMKAQPYRLDFKPDFFTVRLDNSILFMRYQSVRQHAGSFANPSLGGLISVSLNDVMENHRFTGGIRLPVNFSGLTYFLQYENFTRRTDWGILYLRSENYYTIPVTFVDASTGVALFSREYTGRNVTNMIQGSAAYPIDRIRSIRMHMGVREDVLDFKAQDTLSLAFLPRDRQYWALSRAEYVFDNSISPTLNIRQGFRYKFFAEYMYQLSKGGGGCYNFGTDFRYYHKVYKNLTLATRIAAAHSAGKYKILYYLGGVDNWVSPKFNQYTPPSTDGNFAFQTLATNMRGYPQNARNGSTYAVFNGELRFPVVATFIRRPIQSAMLRHLQLVPFVDAGSAWNGLFPNSENASGNYRFGPDQQAPNVSLDLKVPGTGGLAMGYGAGLRTMVFSYFMRLDAAWNIEGRRKPIWYFSIGTDF